MMRLYSLGELDTKRAGQPWWNGWSKAFDEARFETFDYDDETFKEMTEDDRCDDEIVEAFADENYLKYDECGHLWRRR